MHVYQCSRPCQAAGQAGNFGGGGANPFRISSEEGQNFQLMTFSSKFQGSMCKYVICPPPLTHTHTYLFVEHRLSLTKLITLLHIRSSCRLIVSCPCSHLFICLHKYMRNNRTEKRELVYSCIDSLVVHSTCVKY